MRHEEGWKSGFALCHEQVLFFGMQPGQVQYMDSKVIFIPQ